MNKIFALDLGTNSIGWALRNPDLIQNQIEKFGVITFNRGVGMGKTGEYSYAAERTKKRSTRRLYQARKYRLWATLEHLIIEGYCPLSIDNLNRWRHYNKEEARTNSNGGRVYPVEDRAFDAWIKLDFNGDGKADYQSPYQLRKELTEIVFDFSAEANRYKIGRALYHIAQRRGFKSSRKGAENISEKEENNDEIVDLQYSEKKKNKVINDFFDKYPEAKTIGALFAKIENSGIRIRENIAQHAIRENYKNEIKYIFQFQNISTNTSLYKKIVESGTNKNDGSIFFKRPLRSQKGLIGKCTLEPNKYRAPISHPDFEIFRAWSFLNNIKYKHVGDTNARWQSIPLDLKNRILEDKFFRKSKIYFPFSEIESFVKKEGYKWELNYKPKTTVTGCPLSARLKEIFGNDYLAIKLPKAASEKSGKNYYDVEDIWHVLFSYEDQEYVADFAKEKLGLDEEKLKQFITAWNNTPVGYAMLSLNAIKKINLFLQKGLIYTEAVLLANIPQIVGKEVWNESEQLFIDEIGNLIEENRVQKSILDIVNGLISAHKNLTANEKFGFKDNNYTLEKSDFADIERLINEQFGKSKWEEKSETERNRIYNAVKDCYQNYFIVNGLKRKDINNDRHFVVQSNNVFYYKSDSGYYRLPKIKDTLAEFLQSNFSLSDSQVLKIYHPSEINIYPPAQADKDGNLLLGSPQTGSFKNPMAMRTLHELRKLMNFLIETKQIDSDTRIIVEVARDLNDANKRWAIETWQKQREAENAEFASAIEQLVNEAGITADSQSNDDINKIRLWYEQNDEESVPPIAEDKKEVKGIRWSENKRNSYKEIATKKEMIDKYRLWREQECQCIYTGKIIKLTDLFNDNILDFEHTIPRSLSFDNSLANLTICYADFNRTVKKKQIPFNLNNYEEILFRIRKWQEKVERIKQQVDFWKTKSKKAATKDWKDEAIRQRHLWQMELDYWRNKVDRFTMEEITSGFKNSQKIDTQLISKYAFHYLKTYFERVDVQKGSITAEFRKIYGLQSIDEKKDRGKHSHHAKDAAVLTLIPIAAKRDEILQKYYEHKESKQNFVAEPYKGFKREFVWDIDDNVLINYISNNQSLSPAKRFVRKKGKIQLVDGTDRPKVSTGDCIRGQLHDETLLGAIKLPLRDDNGGIVRNDKGDIIQEEKIRFVVRVPFLFKKDASSSGFKTLEDIEKQIVDPGLKEQIRKQVLDAGGLKEAFEHGIYMLDKKGNKVNKIRHIRVFKVSAEPLQIKKHTYLSKFEYKQYYYANNATNSFFALYVNEEKADFDFRNLLDTAKMLSLNGVKSVSELFEPSILVTKGKKSLELKLKYILKSGLKVIFLKADEKDIKHLNNREMLKRLYEYTGFEKNGNSARLNFKYHLEARNSKEIVEEYNESDIDFESPKPTLRFSYAKYVFLVEGFDFRIHMDGTIDWLL